jgi:predicted DNA-binding transcriptional regulator YafY
MNSPTARALALLELLQNHDALSGTELARRLDVDGRTLRRYIAKLRELDIPVESERGRYGVYRLAAGAKLPPVMFTDAEALAVSVALTFAGSKGLIGGLQGAESALGKLDRVTPKALRTKLRALTKTMQLERRADTAPIPGQALLELSAATHDRQRVHLHYAAANQEVTERDFDCYGLSWREGFWYALGYCHLREDLRSFRVDRITAITPLKKHFVPPMNFDAVRHLALGMASIPRRHSVTVKLKTDMATARDALFDAIGLFTPAAKQVTLYSQVDDLGWYARQLARLPFDFEVVEPAALRKAVQVLAARLLRLTKAG